MAVVRVWVSFQVVAQAQIASLARLPRTAPVVVWASWPAPAASSARRVIAVVLLAWLGKGMSALRVVSWEAKSVPSRSQLFAGSG